MGAELCCLIMEFQVEQQLEQLQLSNQALQLQNAELQQQLTAAQQAAQQVAQHAPQVAQLPVGGLKPPKPGLYSGGRDVANWLFSLEQYFAAAGINHDAARVAYAGTCFDGAARDWWRVRHEAVVTDPQAVPLPQTWQELKTQLQGRFTRITEEEFARASLKRLRQVRGVRKYVVDFNTMVLKIPSMDERSKLDQFLSGLKEAVRRHVRQQRPVALEAAMRLAEEFETGELQDRLLEREYGRRVRDRDFYPNQSGQRGNQAEKAVAMEVDNAKMQQGAQGGSAKPKGKQGKGKFAQNKRTVRKCYNCGEPGHLIAECPKPKQQQRAGRANAAQGSETDNSEN